MACTAKQFKNRAFSDVSIFKRDSNDSFTSSRLRIFGIFLKYNEYVI